MINIVDHIKLYGVLISSLHIVLHKWSSNKFMDNHIYIYFNYIKDRLSHHCSQVIRHFHNVQCLGDHHKQHCFVPKKTYTIMHTWPLLRTLENIHRPNFWQDPTWRLSPCYHSHPSLVFILTNTTKTLNMLFQLLVIWLLSTTS